MLRVYVLRTGVSLPSLPPIPIEAFLFGPNEPRSSKHFPEGVTRACADVSAVKEERWRNKREIRRNKGMKMTRRGGKARRERGEKGRKKNEGSKREREFFGKEGLA